MYCQSIVTAQQSLLLQYLHFHYTPATESYSNSCSQLICSPPPLASPITAEIEKGRAPRSSQSGEYTKCDISRTPSISGEKVNLPGAVRPFFFSLLGRRVIKQSNRSFPGFSFVTACCVTLQFTAPSKKELFFLEKRKYRDCLQPASLRRITGERRVCGESPKIDCR